MGHCVTLYFIVIELSSFVPNISFLCKLINCKSCCRVVEELDKGKPEI